MLQGLPEIMTFLFGSDRCFILILGISLEGACSDTFATDYYFFVFFFALLYIGLDSRSVRDKLCKFPDQPRSKSAHLWSSVDRLEWRDEQL